MKTMIRVAAAILTVSLAGISGSCSPSYPVEVHRVYHHSYSNSSYSPYYPGTVEYSKADSYSGGPRSFEPVSRF